MLLKFMIYLLILFCITLNNISYGQSSMGNVLGRNTISLNGKWNYIIDPNNNAEGMGIAYDARPTGKTDFLEYYFDESASLQVPGDFNSQLTELTYYENYVWYKKTFAYKKNEKRLFLHFGAVNYKADVYLNGEKLGIHEGGYTPFQFEITDKVKAANTIIVKVNNKRYKDGIPELGYDWFNYGGINRDVNLIETPPNYIEDYFIQLKKGKSDVIKGWVKLDGKSVKQQVRIAIPELKLSVIAKTNDSGFVSFEFNAKVQRWSPENPKLYKVKVTSENDTILDDIGFRTIETKGTEILLNGKSIFLKGVNIHEEISAEKRKSVDEKDALQLLSAAKELGCNFVRLTHYPHHEYMVRLADKMGLLLWEEIPVWQWISFEDTAVRYKMNYMMKEIIQRDKNRCSIIVWSVSNETMPTAKARFQSIAKLAQLTKQMDDTRLVSSAFNNIRYDKNQLSIRDSLIEYMDIVGLNEYLGWYTPWVGKPSEYVWKFDFNKPVIISEFGVEALYGNHGSADTASSWTEEYQEQVYKDNVTMFKNMSSLRGVAPWVLYDFRSARRMHGRYQKGWNRKGLLSNGGEKKKSWFVIKSYFDSIKN